MKQQRGINIWLGFIGVVVGIGSVAELTTAPVIGLAMAGSYLALLAVLFASERVRQLQRSIPNLSVAVRGTQAARQAVARARRLAGTNTPETVMDLGLIINEKNRSGAWQPKRTAEAVSTADQAIQPFIKISVPADQSHRTLTLRFDVLDREGQVQLSREVKQFVREGDNLIPCDRQMSIRDNPKIGRAGTWELQVSINGILAASHTFTVTQAAADSYSGSGSASYSQSSSQSQYRASGTAASSAPSRQKLADDGEAPLAHNLSTPDEEDDDDQPLTLEELLREQRGKQS
jgi:hypothetical protein